MPDLAKALERFRANPSEANRRALLQAHANARRNAVLKLRRPR